MSERPIFVATHPRACSTAFERVFMTRRDILQCIHEPFGDAFYFGPERLGARYADDEEGRRRSGFENTTYKDVMDGLLNPEGCEGKRLFIKDIAHYLLPPDGQPASIAPSLQDSATPNGVTPNGIPSFTTTPTTNGTSHPRRSNPTVIPLPLLRTFHFTFLIRHPRRAVPSYYRCTVPPLSNKTGFHNFLPAEAGYDELRRLFDYLRAEGVVVSREGDGDGKGDGEGMKITVVDADDLLDRPGEVIEAFCEDVGIDYHEGMLRWGDEEGQRLAVEAFEKWNGFHDDAIGSTGLRARVGGKKPPTAAEEDEEWRRKFGEEGQRVIRATVDANVADYEYLKSFALKF
ncbi:P-loop containing nucleoside triphosphate hydrolase protein [Staphylotrichum tortipilum]|uniref:P-loop containing nucleoside triphosphate hydrolase protein n=1 Tax=Staphylotrichum tortipilum TaxID=2831512 RepID=A0AAN6RQ24_9PEZI|nr:P-loop containing nucleoside triphosphate hydrolase protein [Staphylotrichum longicolle]